jgi:hypothetical protein
MAWIKAMDRGCILRTADRDRIRLREILPGLIALLKKYYSTVILDPGCDPGDDLSSAALDQSDRLVLVQSCRDPHVLRTRAFGEAVSWCAQLDTDFFERAILVTHERPGDGPLQHPMEGRFRYIRLRGVSVDWKKRPNHAKRRAKPAPLQAPARSVSWRRGSRAPWAFKSLKAELNSCSGRNINGRVVVPRCLGLAEK